MAQDPFWRAFLAHPSDELSGAADRLHAQLVGQGIDALIASAYLTYAPLHHERNAVRRFTEQNPDWRGSLPEITTPAEACRYASGDFRLPAAAMRELARLLATPPSELFNASPAPPHKSVSKGSGDDLRKQTILKILRMPPAQRERLLYLEKLRRGMPTKRRAPHAADPGRELSQRTAGNPTAGAPEARYPIRAEEIHIQGQPAVGSYAKPPAYATAVGADSQAAPPTSRTRPSEADDSRDTAGLPDVDPPGDAGSVVDRVEPPEQAATSGSAPTLRSTPGQQATGTQGSPPRRKLAWQSWAVGALAMVALVTWVIESSPSESEKLRDEIALNEADIRQLRAEWLRTSLECAADRVEFPDRPQVAAACERVRALNERSYASMIESKERWVATLRQRLEEAEAGR